MYTVHITKEAEKDMKKLDQYSRKIISSWIMKRLEGCDNPRAFGKALTANKKGLWRHRVGDYRIICDIEDDKIIILILAIGHRREIYDK